MNEEFRKKYPNLAKELLDSEPAYTLTFKGQDSDLSQNSSVDPLKGFSPSAVDFIRRCKTKEEALEIINFLVEHKDLDSKTANSMRKKLESEGLSAFGTHKNPGYYHSSR